MNEVEEGDVRFDNRERTSTELPTSSSTDIPAIPTFIHLSLTIVYTIFYSFLFLLVYIQLLLILWYKHKRFSYQSVFLFLCLIWAALRTTLFSFYFKNPISANNLSALPFWFLYCCPICLQFVTLSLLVLFFSQVLFSAKSKYEPAYSYLKKVLRILVSVGVLIFVSTNIISAIIIRQQQSVNLQPYGIITARVFINELLFLISGISLAVCVYKLTKTTSSKLILETKGTTMCQTLATCALIILLYVSRAAYNIIVVTLARNATAPSFNFGWINVTDQSNLKGIGYITFGIVLFIWEFLPTFVVVLFFRVKRPNVTVALPELSNNSLASNSQAYFFDNPRRYDSDDELFKSAVTSHDYLGQGNEHHVIRSNRFTSPYGSFHSSYIFRQSSLGHSSAIGSISTLTGSHRDRFMPTSKSNLHTAVINFHKQNYNVHR